MDRRKAIKAIAGIGALAFLPHQHLFAARLNKPLHFVGLGRTGTKLMLQARERGHGQYYTAITTPDRQELPQEVNLLPYIPHNIPSRHERVMMEISAADQLQSFELPDEVATHFSPDHCYVLLTALGGYTGTNMCNDLIPMFLDSGRSFQAICSTPFNFEGTKKVQWAMQTVEKFTHLPQFRHFHYEAMRKTMGNMNIRDAFARLDQEFLATWERKFNGTEKM